jgi:prophage antirepressor-like protein
MSQFHPSQHAIQAFQYQDRPLRAHLDAHGDPWFVVADVCEAMDVPDVAHARKYLVDREQALISIQGSCRDSDRVPVVNARGVYALILGIHSPAALDFGHWFSTEALPALARQSPSRSAEPCAPVADACAVIPFQFGEKLVRTVTDERGEPLFVGKDVCDVLGYADHTNAMKQHCKGVVKHHPLQTPGGVQDLRVLSEPDVLRLISGSRLPATVAFGHWFSTEAFPALARQSPSRSAEPCAPVADACAVIPFQFGEKLVRTVTDERGEPLFVGKDVCDVLGYADHTNAMKQHCKGVVKHHPLQTPGGVQDLRVLSEPDVLRLIISSKLPAAAAFERWVFEDVLPTIRKTGKYEASKADIPVPDPGPASFDFPRGFKIDRFLVQLKAVTAAARITLGADRQGALAFSRSRLADHYGTDVLGSILGAQVFDSCDVVERLRTGTGQQGQQDEACPLEQSLAFLGAWHARHQQQPVGSYQLAELLQCHPGLLPWIRRSAPNRSALLIRLYGWAAALADRPLELTSGVQVRVRKLPRKVRMPAMGANGKITTDARRAFWLDVLPSASAPVSPSAALVDLRP